MKSAKLSSLLALAVATAILSTGCHGKNPHGVTPLPGRTEKAPSGPGPGGFVTPTPGVGDTPTGIVLGEGHPNWKQDRESLKTETVHFDYDSSAVKKSEDAKVGAVAAYLKNNSSAALKVEGHCDERGTEEYNRALGERRALAVREALVKTGIDPARVDTISYGEDRPFDPGHAESAWRKNRRAEFVVLTPP